MKTKVILSLLLFTTILGFSQININQISNSINKAVTGSKSLSNDDIVKGLKEALSVGSKNASDSASKKDGYFKNPKIKIPLPKDVKKAESTLRSMGMGSTVDNFILSMNRAAEEAAKKSTPIFVNAVTSMTITDGVQILKGADTSATNYLRKTTYTPLKTEFKPVIRSAIEKAEVTKYYKPLVTKYNKIPFVKKLNPNLDEYITDRALSGLFYLVSQEEIKIRKDPAARVTDILKKVFGN
jgi:Protein of unknown function (DUF4197)